MNKQILIYEKDSKVQKFLRAFFKAKDGYSTHFTRKDRSALRKEILKRKPDALIISSPDGLKHINPEDLQCPVIAIVSSDKMHGIRSVIESDIECYLLSPFHKDELNSTLQYVIKKKHWLNFLLKEKEDLQTIIELTDVISATLNPKAILNLIVQKISEIIHVTRCSFVSIGIGSHQYADVISSSDAPEISNIRIDLKKYPEIKRALTSRKTTIVKDAQKDPLMKEVRKIIKPIGIRSIIVVPVIFRDEVIGTLLLRTSRAGHTFSKREIKLCVALASASANALYNAFLYDRLSKEKTRLEKLAITDYLTGVYNIRYFYNRIEEEFSRAERYKHPLSCIMIDIDHFKYINDSYGHRVGDMVLREFAQLVKTYTRKSDVFARYGGEEFITLLPQTAKGGAVAEAERIKQAVSEHWFSADSSKIKITISIGIACSPNRKIKDFDDLIHYADNALFKAKQKGRDRIVTYPSYR